jgi:hypothetical protein
VVLPALNEQLAAINPPFAVTMDARYSAGAPDPSPAVGSSRVQCRQWPALGAPACLGLHTARSLPVDVYVTFVPVTCTAEVMATSHCSQLPSTRSKLPHAVSMLSTDSTLQVSTGVQSHFCAQPDSPATQVGLTCLLMYEPLMWQSAHAWRHTGVGTP